MKTFRKCKNFSDRSMKIAAGSLIFLMVFMLSCSQLDVDPVLTDDVTSIDARQPDDITTNIAHLRQISKDEPIYLSGVQNYYTYASKIDEVLQDGDLPCNIILEFLEGHNVKVTIDEGRPGGPGEYYGTMTPSGQIMFSIPSPMMIFPNGSALYITDIIQMHSGCEIYGRGINKGTLIYMGYFDGERLWASAPFHSKCPVEWPDNDLFETPVEGPVHWSWTIDVTVD